MLAVLKLDSHCFIPQRDQVSLYEAGCVVIMEWLRHYEAFQGLFSRRFKVSHYTNKQTLRSLSTSNMPRGQVSLQSQLRWRTHDGLWWEM